MQFQGIFLTYHWQGVLLPQKCASITTIESRSIPKKENVILIFSIGNWYVLESEDGFVCISPMVMLLNRDLVIAQLQKLMKLSWKQGWDTKRVSCDVIWSLGNSEELLLLQRWNLIKQIWLFVFLRMCFVMGCFLSWDLSCSSRVVFMAFVLFMQV